MQVPFLKGQMDKVRPAPPVACFVSTVHSTSTAMDLLDCTTRAALCSLLHTRPVQSSLSMHITVDF